MKRSWRIFLVLLTLVLLIAVAGGTYCYFKVSHFLASDGFRNLVSDATAKSLHVTGEFSPIQWNGTSAYANSFTATGLPGGAIKSLKAYQIRTELDWSDLIHGNWHLSNIDVASLELELQDSPRATERESETPSNDSRATGTTPDSSAGPGKSVLIDQVLVQNARVIWPSGGEEPPTGSLSDTKVTLKAEDKSWLISAAGGKIHQPGLPDFTLREGSLRYHQNTVYILNTTLLHPEHGQVVITGEAKLQPVRQIKLDFDVQKIPVSSFLSNDWRARLTGDLAGQVQFTDPEGSSNSNLLKGNLRLEDGRIEALPALDQLADATGTRDFKSMRLHTARTTFEKRGADLKLSGIKIESETLLRVEGRVDVAGNVLNGLLDVGTVPAAIRLLPGAESGVFTRKADGYIWAAPAVTVTGTLDKPVEDLSPRIKQAALQKVGEKIGEIGGKIKDAINSGKVDDAINKVLDLFKAPSQ